MTKKRSSEIFRRKLGFEGPANLFMKGASKSLIRLCSELLNSQYRLLVHILPVVPDCVYALEALSIL